MMRKTTWWLVCACLTVTIVGSASAQPTSEPERAVELFFSGLKTGQVDTALARIARGSVLADKQQQLKVLENQIGTALSLYGTPIAEEKVFREPMGESILRLVYLQKFEHLPLVWEFHFYRARSRWMLINIQFNDQLDLLEKDT